jgi:hypothetical protein
MPWLLKALFVLLKTRRGRKLLFTVGLTTLEVARHERARKLYAQARKTVTDPAHRERVARYSRKAAKKIRR